MALPLSTLILLGASSVASARRIASVFGERSNAEAKHRGVQQSAQRLFTKGAQTLFDEGPANRTTRTCCCKAGSCDKVSHLTGSAGHPPKHIFVGMYNEEAELCCVETGDHCDMIGFKVKKDINYCRYVNGDVLGNGRAHYCRTPLKKLHSFIDFGDTGCTPMLKQDGSFASSKDQGLYTDRDCPFPGGSAEDKVRRALLAALDVARPATYGDMMMSCLHPETAKDGLVLNTTGERWSFLRTNGAISRFMASMSAEKRTDWICRTARLLPTMWSRAGLRDTGFTEDTQEVGYPRSKRGDMFRGSSKSFDCHHYTDYSVAETRLVRRVVRALLPTWAVHTFVEGKDKLRGKGSRQIFGMDKPNIFQGEVARECAAGRSDDEIANGDFVALRNAEVMKRDEDRCRRSYPCFFQDPDYKAAKGRSCKCHAAICWSFAKDFNAALKKAAQAESCRARGAIVA